MKEIDKLPATYRPFFERKPPHLAETFLHGIRDYADSDRAVFGFFGICGCADGGKGPTIETLVSLEVEVIHRAQGRRIRRERFRRAGLVRVGLPKSTQSSRTEVLDGFCAICHECAKTRLWVQLPLGVPRFGLPPSNVLSGRQFRRFESQLSGVQY